MRGKIRWLSIAVTLVIVIALAIVAFSPPAMGLTRLVETGGSLLLPHDPADIPQSVVEDATSLATELFGDHQGKCEDFVNQLLTIYSQVKDKDVMVIFNTGWWGNKPLDSLGDWESKSTPLISGWESLLTGIESELAGRGYSSILLEHMRTDESLFSHIGELGQYMTGYAAKAKDLAGKVEFITTHISDIMVILAGECHGAVLSDRVMSILGDNPRVYSIQNGPPFWHKNVVLDRTLLTTDNGMVPDTFSEGDFIPMAWGWLKYSLGLSQPVDYFGTPPHYVGAPGHDYWWQYPKVRSEIVNFLDEHFGVNGDESLV